MAGLIAGVFASILKNERDRLNARFAEAKRLRPNLDEDAFGKLLVHIITPIVEAVDLHDPSKTHEAVNVLYDISLDLLGQGFMGPQARYPFIMQGWSDLLPNIPQHISAAPRAAIGSITNALYNLSQVGSARPQEWLEAMAALAPLAPDVSSFLQAGQIASWRAGLSHFRSGTLDLCKKVPVVLTRVALGLSPANDAPPVMEIVEQMEVDPWLRPDQVGKVTGSQNLKIVSRTGAFRGFGGLFRKPPLVIRSEGHFVVKEDNTRWLLIADIFGATFHRVDGVEESESMSSVRIERNGKVSLGRMTRQFDELSDYTSAVVIDGTMAVTTPLSYSVFLLALVSE